MMETLEFVLWMIVAFSLGGASCTVFLSHKRRKPERLGVTLHDAQIEPAHGTLILTEDAGPLAKGTILKLTTSQGDGPYRKADLNAVPGKKPTPLPEGMVPKAVAMMMALKQMQGDMQDIQNSVVGTVSSTQARKGGGTDDLGSLD